MDSESARLAYGMGKSSGEFRERLFLQTVSRDYFLCHGARLLLYRVAIAPSAVREVAGQAGIKTPSSLLLVRGGQCGVGLMRHSPVSV